MYIVQNLENELHSYISTEKNIPHCTYFTSAQMRSDALITVITVQRGWAMAND